MNDRAPSPQAPDEPMIPSVASTAVDIRLARIRRLKDSTLIFGCVLRQSETVLFVRINTGDGLHMGDAYMFELKGTPDLMFVAKLLDKADEPGEIGEDRGKTYRFGLTSDVLPIGAV